MKVPFTLAHTAAALPFRSLRLVPSALVIAPDFESFLRLSPNGRFGHTLLGTFVLTLPLALAVLWIFHTFVKVPPTMLLPDAIQRRLATHLDGFRFLGVATFLLIVGSVLLGIATHLLWDSFTHRTTWLHNHWLILRQPLRLPIVGEIPYYKVFQQGGTIIGIGIVSAWLVWWYRTSEPATQALSKSPSPAQRNAIIAVVTTIAFAGAITRAVAGIGTTTGHLVFKEFVGQAAVTAMALAWWQLVAYGVFSSSGKTRR